MRPPGHHAESNTAQGFCIYNNAAVAARAAQVSNIPYVYTHQWLSYADLCEAVVPMQEGLLPQYCHCFRSYTPTHHMYPHAVVSSSSTVTCIWLSRACSSLFAVRWTCNVRAASAVSLCCKHVFSCCSCCSKSQHNHQLL